GVARSGWVQASWVARIGSRGWAERCSSNSTMVRLTSAWHARSGHSQKNSHVSWSGTSIARLRIESLTRAKRLSVATESTSASIPETAYVKTNTRLILRMSSTESTSIEPRTWTFLTNHAQVLLCLSGDPEIRLRDVAERVGITERACQRIVADLVATGYVTASRVGRRNHYTVDREPAMAPTAQI